MVFKVWSRLYFCSAVSFFVAPVNLWIFGIIPQSSGEDSLPTVYDYFGSSGNNLTGLVPDDELFMLNGKHIRLVSGTIHYWRVHPALWRDRMKKLRALGANSLETYVAWNLHEPEMNNFDFGDGDNDMSIFLDLRKYIKMAQEEDLLVILRPGPYICGEIDFGGLPSWLLRDPEMKVRTNYSPYRERVELYFKKLLTLLADLHFTRGGSIIAVQIENEYGFWKIGNRDHLEFLYSLLQQYGFAKDMLLFTSDPPVIGNSGTLPGKLLMTGNFQGYVDQNMEILERLQPGKPKFVVEFWTGLSTHWLNKRHVMAVGALIDSLDTIFRKWNGSINFYMFHGGTNFGFTNAGNENNVTAIYWPITTSYDCAAPLSESGDYTQAYKLLKTMVELYQVPKIRQTEMPPESKKTAYSTVEVQEYLNYADIIAQVPPYSKFKMHRPMPMESLPMNNGSGQSFGYVVYRKIAEISNGDKFMAGPAQDLGMLLVDSKLDSNCYKGANYWKDDTREFSLSVSVAGQHVVDLLIENLGRAPFSRFDYLAKPKGLFNVTYKLNGNDITDIEIISLEFKSKWVQSLTDWKPVQNNVPSEVPILVKATFDIKTPTDTFLDMSAWHKGIVFVNGFNIGRYFRVGPQVNLYVPGPLLKTGTNTIVIFEQFEPSNQIVFSDKANFGPVTREMWKSYKLKMCPPDAEQCLAEINLDL